jgi:hypothetical protein
MKAELVPIIVTVNVGRRVSTDAKIASDPEHCAVIALLSNILTLLCIGLRYVLLSFRPLWLSPTLICYQQWTGECFEATSMKALGIKIFLGHNGDPCPVPGDLVKDFTVIDTNGVHNIEAQFCGCYGNAGGSPNRIQLLRSRLLPPTHVRPISAFTFDVLDTFHLLTLQGKTNAYDFYLMLAHKSDNTGLVDINVSGMLICVIASDVPSRTGTNNS